MTEMKSAASSSFSWEILRYARFLAAEDDGKFTLTSTSRNEQKWKYVSPACKDGLKLAITNGHMLLTNGEVVLENYFLPDMRSTMRGFIRGDSLLFVVKIKNEARKFRVRFARGAHPKAESTCEDCATKLSFYFPVKPFEPPESFKTTAQPCGSREAEEEILDGEVSTQEITKVISGDGDKTLPLPYASTPAVAMEADDLNQLLRLFLSEASFPCFVGAVERELDSIVNSREEE